MSTPALFELDVDAVKRIRARRNLDQEALADAVGVQPSTVSDWEHGRHNPGLDSLVCLADALETDIDIITTGRTPA